MSTYFDKKKLLADNSDLYISEYDKALPTADLSGVIEAKRNYQKASSEGNEAAMKAANDKANSIREAAGGYLGGSDGSKRITSSKPYEIRINNKYVSPYESDKKRVLNEIREKGEFSYNPDKDPIFEIYKNLYTKLGDDAYDRALSYGALRTGGVVSTSAQSAATQAKNRYNSMLTSKIPELYDSAYKKYQSEYERLYDELELLTNLDESEYEKHRDTLYDWEADREYYYQKDSDEYDRNNNQYEFDSDMEYNIRKDENENTYRQGRDEVEDEHWDKEYDRQVDRDEVEDEHWDKEYDRQVDRDEVEDEHWEKEYDYRAERDGVDDKHWEKEYDYRAERDGVDDEHWEKEYNYKVERDAVEDEHWEKEFEGEVDSDMLGHAINIAKAIFGKKGFTAADVRNIIRALE